MAINSTNKVSLIVLINIGEGTFLSLGRGNIYASYAVKTTREHISSGAQINMRGAI